MRLFTSAGEDPCRTTTFRRVDCVLRDADGREVFRQADVSAPAGWSDAAVTIAAYKYFRGAPGDRSREQSISQLVDRVSQPIVQGGAAQGYFTDTTQAQDFAAELKYLLLHQYAAFNSPVWFHLGIDKNPQCSACFILSVQDSLESLLDLQKLEAMVFKHGSGAGTDLSAVRSAHEPLGDGGTASGPVSFMHAYDAWARTIEHGGMWRRAAKMQTLAVDHPDILEFITSKLPPAQFESLRAQYSDLPWSRQEPRPYRSALENSNLSVRVTDLFMRAATQGECYETRRILDGTPQATLSAAHLLEVVAQSAHACGDPGLLFADAVNRWHTCPAEGPIHTSNPCGEFLYIDNSACNLASINLLKFVKRDKGFDSDRFAHAVSILTTALDILIDIGSYPSKEIARNSMELRPLGLGFTNLGATLMSCGIPYGAKEAQHFAASIASLMTSQAYSTSAELAARCGPFKRYDRNRESLRAVLRMHRNAAVKAALSNPLINAHLQRWDQLLELSDQVGLRNAQVTAIAPTGTISLLMDCDTSGVEPAIGLWTRKTFRGGAVMERPARVLTRALEALGYQTGTIEEIVGALSKGHPLEQVPSLRREHLPIFDCALPGKSGRALPMGAHLEMVAALQPFISGGISKTVNMPADSSSQEIRNGLLQSWELGLKSISFYRDGSRERQPVTTHGDGEDRNDAAIAP